MMEDLRVLSLERTPHRLELFHSRNPHVPCVVQTAVDGQTVDRLRYPSLKHSDGALGCLLSHMAFWDEVIEAGRPMTIFEDDAIVHLSFMGAHRKVLESLPKDWDIILWGWNFNALLMFDMVPGAWGGMQCELGELRRHIDRYQNCRLAANASKLYRAWGTVGYAISPSGAKFLRRQDAITQDVVIQFPDMGETQVLNVGVDVMMNAFYPMMNAFVCIPPLVVTTMDDSTIGPTA
jgi:GR25 family glycosyltransferase involved in LPS biosynthesis